MTSIKKNALAVCALVLLGCAAMTVVDGVLRPPYAVKSAVKLTLFLLAPLLYEYTAGRDGHRALFRIQRRALLRALLGSAYSRSFSALILRCAASSIFPPSPRFSIRMPALRRRIFYGYRSMSPSSIRFWRNSSSAALPSSSCAGTRASALPAAYFLIFSTQGLGRSSPLGQFISLQTLPSTRSALFFSRSYKISEIWWESQANNA